MSQGARKTHFNVRLLIDDTDREQYAISVFKLSAILNRTIQLVATRTYQSLSAAPTSLSLVAGTVDYSLVGAPTSIRQIVLNSDGIELEKIDLATLNDMFRQDASGASASRGIPRFFALYETNSAVAGTETTCKIRVGPTPSAADTLRIYYDLLPNRDSGDWLTGPGAIPLSPPLISAVENLTASSCLMSMDDDDLKRRKISRGYAQILERDAEKMIAEHNFRQRMLEAQDTVDEVNTY
jgi:hypothetical protein